MVREQQQSSASALLHIRVVGDRVGLSRASVYERMRSDPTFPRPIYLGPKTVRFFSRDVDRWIEEQVAKRDAQSAAELEARSAKGRTMRERVKNPGRHRRAAGAARTE